VVEEGGDNIEAVANEDAVEESRSDPIAYFMQRLNMMSRRRGDDRRVAVFQFYAAFASSQPIEVVVQHLPSIVDALYRCKVDGQSNIQKQVTVSQDTKEEEMTVIELGDEVMTLLEQKVGSEAYLAVYGQVQRRFTEKRDKRKRQRAAEAVIDPKAFAERKLERNKLKKEGEKRRKRVFGEMRKIGGSSGKGKGKGKGRRGGSAPGSSAGGLKHGGGGFGRKRPKG
jgi:U3 small nucleolar RNA-associated protein 20